MNSKVFTVLRIILALILLVFGLNKFFHYLPQPDVSADAGAFFGALISTKTFMLIAIVEVLAGFAFLLNKYAALMAVILMSVSVNIILYHLSLDAENIGPGLILFILNIAMLYNYRDKYKELLKA
ncbi:DoxX family membrane protein [Snuella sedimenti]|uniref:DoxX family membrane protein n=1 Tax=Snuella sedimenti TaxID=2798802 RepID=A0A8J7LML3_9FLAO|nr:DoxX family membrane protein [Snuella sedimenti]MBJ6366838.1 DoxX family membrane protein [Snuella sedimenti]